MSEKLADFVAGGRGSPTRYNLGLSIALTAPLILLLAGAFLYRLAKLISQSVFAPLLTGEHYARLAEESLFIRVFWRTIRISATCTVLAFILGYPVSLALTRASSWWRLLLLGCVLVPLWTSVLSRSYAWVILLQRRGIVNDVLVNTGVVDQPLRLLYTEGALVVAMVHILLPFMILPIYSALQSIPPELTRAARNLGAGPWRAFINVTLPLSLPGVFAGSLIVFILSMGFYVAPAIVGGSSTLVISTLIGQQMMIQLNWPLAGALCSVLLICTLLLATTFRRFLVLSQRGV